MIKTNLLFLLKPKADLVYLFDDCTLRQAMEKMKAHRYSVVPVINHEGKYVRTISEGDLLAYFIDNKLDFEQSDNIKLSDVPSYRSYKLGEISAEPKDILDIIMGQNFVPLADDQGTFIGIVTRQSVMRAFVKDLEEQ
ncbi:MAG: CBS domain-containing protein [Bacilli bacterium]|nr:CBS domain-containing protein [Bacilli bacterium]MBR6056346.1 CBS domain-containing protein [Bacilli bacterium]